MLDAWVNAAPDVEAIEQIGAAQEIVVDQPVEYDASAIAAEELLPSYRAFEAIGHKDPRDPKSFLVEE